MRLKDATFHSRFPDATRHINWLQQVEPLEALVEFVVVKVKKKNKRKENIASYCKKRILY